MENSSLFTLRGLTHPAYAVSPLTGLITGLIITLHSTLYTGVDTPAYSVSPLRG